jgi:alpha-L-fucosidase
MNIPRFPAVLLAAAFVPLGVQSQISSSLPPSVIVDTSAEPMAEGDFQPTWESLSQFEVPDWFRDAKFGIWAHWGPQCQPGWGDWYAREMYCEGEYRNRRHNADYGHPSVFGFKDVINEWKAENWYPEQLMALYRRAGARYFMALANHHDNFDNWDSKYQPWNSVNMGPRRDIIAQWAQAARKFGMKFGVSVHAAHAWSWYETSQGADKEGQLAGVPYDGRMTLADGLGKWWEGFDPQDLYEQRHAPAPGFEVPNSIHARWNWGNGVTQPDLAYCQKFYDRTMDLIVRYKPELIYFDDTALPLWPVSDAGLKIAAGFYNMNDGLHGDNGMLFGKVLTDDQRECMAWDIERGVSNRIEPHPWQTCTCLGQWHYDKLVLEEHRYKSAETSSTLDDIVIKNGNLLLSVPQRGDGTPDSEELEILEASQAGWRSTASHPRLAPVEGFWRRPADRQRRGDSGPRLQRRPFQALYRRGRTLHDEGRCLVCLRDGRAEGRNRDPIPWERRQTAGRADRRGFPSGKRRKHIVAAGQRRPPHRESRPRPLRICSGFQNPI